MLPRWQARCRSTTRRASKARAGNISHVSPLSVNNRIYTRNNDSKPDHVTKSRSGFWSVLVFMERELELSLVRRLRAGDTVAFDEVYSAFNSRLFRFLNRMTRNRHVAEDLVEETWLRLVRPVAQDLDEDTRLGAWLFTVARNLCISSCRASSRQQSCAIDFLSLWPDVCRRRR